MNRGDDSRCAIGQQNRKTIRGPNRDGDAGRLVTSASPSPTQPGPIRDQRRRSNGSASRLAIPSWDNGGVTSAETVLDPRQTLQERRDETVHLLDRFVQQQRELPRLFVHAVT